MEKGNRKIIPLPGGRSEVWKRKLFGFYSNDGKTILDKQRAVCCVCLCEIPYSGNTTNLGIHLAKKHSDIYLSMKAELELVKPDGKLPANRNIGSTVMQHANQQAKMAIHLHLTHIRDAIATFLVRDLHPLCVVEGEGFRHLLQVLEPRYESLETHALLDVLQRKKQAITNSLLERLVEIEACALATDCWLADNGRTYCTLMVRFIDANWEIQNSVLKTLEITPDQTHANHIWDINRVLADWTLMPRILCHQSMESSLEMSEDGPVDNPIITVELSQMKVIVGVTNENANVALALKHLGMTSLPCFANVVNAAVEAGINADNAPIVSTLIAKSRRLVSHFVRNAKDRSLLLIKRNSEMLNNAEDLVLDVQNRWKTTADMIGRLLELKNPLNSVLMSHKERSVRELGLTPEEWYQIEELHGAMKAISMSIGILGGDEHASCSMVAPLLHRLKEKFMKISEHDTQSVLQYKKVVWDHLNPHYNDSDIQSLFNIAAFLDPRFKDLFHLTSQHRNDVIDIVRQMVLEIDETQHGILGVSQQDEDPNSPPPKKQQRMQELDLLFGSVEVKGIKSDMDQVDKYLQETAIGIKESPLHWWKLNCHRYPSVAKLARRHMCVPAIAVSSECVLSQDGSVFYNRRKRLTAEDIDDMVFLNKNFHLLEQSTE